MPAAAGPDAATNGGSAEKRKTPVPLEGRGCNKHAPRCHPDWGPALAGPPLRAYGLGFRRTDTPLPITAEKPAPPT